MHVSPNVTLGGALSDSNFGSHRGIALSELADWVNTQNDRSTLQKIAIGNRWSERSSKWKDTIANAESYVNFKENYARVNSMIEK